MSAHTPGPWRVSGQRIEFGPMVAGDGWAVAKVLRDTQGDGGTWQANARLIAAAPRMLELLEEVAAFRAMAEQEHDPIMLRLTGEAMRIIKEATNA